MTPPITPTRCARQCHPYAALVLLLALAVAPAGVLRAATPPLTQAAFLVASDGAPGDEFGSSVALSADGATVIVGARGKTIDGAGKSGVVYLYTRQGAGSWSQQAELPDPHPGRSSGVGSAFGTAVALSADGNIALVGAPLACDPAACTNTQYGQEGAVYVFARRAGTWTQTAVLTDPQHAYRDHFGIAVALSGDGRRALVGAPGAHANNGPAAYIFSQTRGVWSATGRLTAPAPQADKEYSFGSAVALSRDGALAVVGADHTEVGSALDQGAAYLYTARAGHWSRAATLTAADGAADQEFGAAVAVAHTATGPLALIGALGIQEPCPCGNPTKSAGAVYIFSAGGRAVTQTAELQDPAHTSWDGFGVSLALTPDGRNVFIGAAFTYWWTAPAANGRAYLFTHAHGAWTLAQRFFNPHPGEREYFGGAGALDAAAHTVFVTAGGYPGDTATNANQGAIYVYG